LEILVSFSVAHYATVRATNSTAVTIASLLEREIQRRWICVLHYS
jgi:hypothetical protein